SRPMSALRKVFRFKWPLALLLASGLVTLVIIGGCQWWKTNPTGAGDSNPAEEELTGPALFEEKTQDSGVDFTYRNGEENGHLAILESLGGGGALIDFDGDGKLDLF